MMHVGDILSRVGDIMGTFLVFSTLSFQYKL